MAAFAESTVQSENSVSEPVAKHAPNGPSAGGQFSNNSAISIKVSVIDVLSNYTVAGVLVGFTPGEVAIQVNEPLSADRTVAVHLTSFSFEGQVLYCETKGAEFEAHVSIDDVDGTGLRRTPRFPVTVPAELLPPDGPPIAITIRDISRDGLGIELPCAMETGRTVAVVSGSVFVFAIVRHCRPAPNGLFRAGVEMHHLFAKPGTDLTPDRPRSSRQVGWKSFFESSVGVRLKRLRLAG
jgi:PilZ domain